MTELERLKDLSVKIIQWADDKGILKKATPEKQFLKFLEETGELAKAILKKDSHEFIDSIGDVFVTIMIHSALTKTSPEFVYKESHEFCLTEHMRCMINCVRPSSYEYALSHLGDIYRINKDLSNNHSFADCVEVAYNVIAKRTGKMVNGTFIKDAD